jgi:hypothetical protein
MKNLPMPDATALGALALVMMVSAFLTIARYRCAISGCKRCRDILSEMTIHSGRHHAGSVGSGVPGRCNLRNVERRKVGTQP